MGKYLKSQVRWIIKTDLPAIIKNCGDSLDNSQHFTSACVIIKETAMKCHGCQKITLADVEFEVKKFLGSK